MRTILPIRTLQNIEILIPKANARAIGQRIRDFGVKTRVPPPTVLNGLSIPIEITADFESDDAPNDREEDEEEAGVS
jgi:hypothetical protein